MPGDDSADAPNKLAIEQTEHMERLLGMLLREVVELRSILGVEQTSRKHGDIHVAYISDLGYQ